jgi:leucyl aminopeptidase
MQVTLTSQPLSAIEADALLILQFEADGRPATPSSDALRASNGPWLDDVESSGEAKGRLFETTILHRPQGFAARRIVLAGAGKAAQFDPASLRRLVGAAVRKAKSNGAARLALALDPAYATPAFASAAAEGVHLGAFEVDKHPASMSKFSIATAWPSWAWAPCSASRKAPRSPRFSSWFATRRKPRPRRRSPGPRRQGRHLRHRRRLHQARRRHGEDEVRHGRRRRRPRRHARHRPAQARHPRHRLRPDRREHAVGGNAQRPGDIVTSLAGKTIEVLNTDAEGRLILVDAITYAKRQGVTHMVDAATLTGAIVVALGYVHVGLFSNNDAFREKFQAAAARQGEKMWHMPLDEEYKRTT